MGYTCFRENLTINLERDKTCKVYRTMRRDILKDNPEAHYGLRCSLIKGGATETEDVGFEIGD